LRGAREAAGPRDRFEDPQLSEVDRHDAAAGEDPS
jgi:hypothetical protein